MSSLKMLLRICLLSSLLTAILVSDGLGQQAQHPNILFIFSDDHGPQAISSYGSYRNRTPGIDRLAAEGMRFANAFCGNSICAPSRATVLTGVHTHVNGQTLNGPSFDNRQETLPEIFQRSGYQTALIGKWHLVAEPMGFDYWDIVIGQGTYYRPRMINNGKLVVREGYTTDVITDLSLEWLSDRRDKRKPFLLMLQHKSPHRNWDPAIRHLTMYKDSTLAEPATMFDDWSTRSSAWTYSEMSLEHHLSPRDLKLVFPAALLNKNELEAWQAAYGPENDALRAANLSGKDLVRWKYQRYAKDYLRSVAAMDEDIARVLTYLDSTGLAKNTIVIYTSDNGWFLGEHGMFDKRWMYEETLRIPLLVRWPGVTQPASVKADLVQNIDYAPTLLDMAGIRVPARMQGKSLVPLLKGSAANWRKSIYYHFYEDDDADHKVPRHYGVRTDRYKLMHFYQLHEWEMYDIQSDPNELKNIVNDAAYAGLRDSLKKELGRLQEEYKVTAETDSEATVFQRGQKKRQRFLSLLGEVPSQLASRVDTVSIERGKKYSRERVSYRVGDQSIEADVYVPNVRKGLLPGIVVVHPDGPDGSFVKGKSLLAGSGPKESWANAVDLCLRGYVVMVPDRFGYESRRAISGPDGEGPSMGVFTAAAERYIGEKSSLMAQEVGEVMFAVNYLSLRPEVHYMRIGVMGVEEGGIVAAVVGAVDRSVAAVVATGGLEKFREVPLPGKPSHVSALLTIPRIQTWGNIEDLLPLTYPRPLLLFGKSTEDESFLKQAFERYSDRSFNREILLHPVPSKNAKSSAELKEAAARWFDTWLKGK